MSTRDDQGIVIYDWDQAGLITFGLFGGALPTTADKFKAGCILIGNGKVYVNSGTSASPSFQDINDVATGEIADLAVTTAKIALLAVDTAQIAANAITTAKILDANVTAGKLASDSVTTAKILAANVTLAKLAAGITPSHIVKFAGKHTTAGGAASEDITVTGAVAGDIVIASLIAKGGTPRTLLTAITGTDKVTLTFSGDPSTDHIVGYQVLRAAA